MPGRYGKVHKKIGSYKQTADIREGSEGTDGAEDNEIVMKDRIG
jgi:hypothetical protein